MSSPKHAGVSQWGRMMRAARGETEAAERSNAFRGLVRAGFVARGITYGLIGALALGLALGVGTGGASPSQPGALAVIAQGSLGHIALLAIAAGLLAYALWKLTQGIFGHGPEGGGGPSLHDRIANLAGGFVYLGFFGVAIRTLIGSGGKSSEEPRHAAAGVLGWPGGRLIVGIAGAALIAISVYQIYDATRGRFAADNKTERMSASERPLFMLLGRIGIVARALVFALVGYFLVRTAIEFNPGSTVGVDGALARLHHEFLGPWLLAFVALGLLVFAAFSLLEARYRRL